MDQLREQHRDLTAVVHLPRGRDATLAISLLQGIGVRTEEARTISDAVRGIPDAGLLLLQQESLDRRGLAELGMALLAQPKWSDLPVLLLTDRNAPLTREIRNLSERTNILFLERPLRRSLLRAMVRSSLQTRRRQLQMRDLLEDLKTAKESAEAATRTKSVFLSQMSHDIRTPLTSILGFAEILRDQAEGPEGEIADHIADSGRRLMDTLNSVLELARLEGRQRQLAIAPVQLQPELERVAKEFRREAESRGLSVSLDCPGNLIVMADRSALGRVLMNLMGNAVKFTHEGGISLKAVDEGENIIIRVEDSGIGISEDFLPHIFEAFRRESSGVTGVADGSGLGLAITRQLVEIMHGSITVESRRGKGSVFAVRLTAAPDGQASEAIPMRRSTPTPWKGRKPAVLVVEDNPSTRHVIRHLLEGTLDATIAEGFDEALNAVREKRFDTGLIDINLGESRSGEDLLRAIRQEPGYSDVPFVAFTAFVLPEEQKRFIENGFHRCLNKPFSKDELLQSVVDALRAREGAESRFS